jgi:ElaB/YqjD/DUF883 family membrane-anchored ribosome-binding protein
MRNAIPLDAAQAVLVPNAAAASKFAMRALKTPVLLTKSILNQEDPAMHNRPNDSDTPDFEHLKQEFNRFRSELAEKLGPHAAEALAQMNSYLEGGNLTSRVGALEAELENIAGRLKGTGRDAVARLEHEVEVRPFISLAVAFGVGILAAQLLRRAS